METRETHAPLIPDVEGRMDSKATFRKSLRRSLPAFIVALAMSATLVFPGAIGSRFRVVGLASPCDLGSNPSAPICIGSLSASVKRGGDTVSVQLDVVNDRGTVQVGKAWWLLSKPGQKPSWLHDQYHSVEQEVALGPRGHRTLDWTEDAVIPDGFYEFSAWIHVKTPTGAFADSYSNTVAPFYINSSRDHTNLLRYSMPAGSAAVRAASATVITGSVSALNSKITVDSRSNDASSLMASLEITATLSGDYARWWEEPVIFSKQNPISVGPGKSVETRFDAVLPVGLKLSPRSYGIRFRLMTPDHAIVDQAEFRTAWIGEPGDPSVRRDFLPTGPMSIEGIEAPLTYTAGQPVTVRLKLRNLTGDSQVVRTWWVFGRVGDPTPWRSLRFQSPPSDSTFKPWATSTIDAMATPIGATGVYELSAWVRALAASEQFEPGDGLWLKSYVRLTAKNR
jgi:hypothetical protein